MRIWSIHPKYLDTKGIVALWREALLAKNVLEGKTKGYKNHPQLNRFKSASKPSDAINYYLSIVYQEAVNRHYNFDALKIEWGFTALVLPVTKGQIAYELGHFLNKLKIRDPQKYQSLKSLRTFDPHPLFDLIEGNVEDWEIIEGSKK
jgi:hypothetical protein